MSLLTRAIGGGIKALYHDVGALGTAIAKDTITSTNVACNKMMSAWALKYGGGGYLRGAGGIYHGMWDNPLLRARMLGSAAGMIAGAGYGASSDSHPWLYGMGGLFAGGVAGSLGGAVFGNRARAAMFARNAWYGVSTQAAGAIGTTAFRGMERTLGTMRRAGMRAWNRW